MTGLSWHGTLVWPKRTETVPNLSRRWRRLGHSGRLDEFGTWTHPATNRTLEQVSTLQTIFASETTPLRGALFEARKCGTQRLYHNRPLGYFSAFIFAGRCLYVGEAAQIEFGRKPHFN